MSETIDNTQPTKATQPVKAQNQDPAQEPEESTQEIKSKPKRKLAGRIGRFLLNILIFLLIIGLAYLADTRAESEYAREHKKNWSPNN